MQCKATALRPFGVEVGGIFDNSVGSRNVKETCFNIITSSVPHAWSHRWWLYLGMHNKCQLTMLRAAQGFLSPLGIPLQATVWYDTGKNAKNSCSLVERPRKYR